MMLKGHSDTITGLSLSPDGAHLLSNAMDNTLRVWDMRPFAPANRCVRMMTGEFEGGIEVHCEGWLCLSRALVSTECSFFRNLSCTVC
jgi:WD40 repeat protein